MSVYLIRVVICLTGLCFVSCQTDSGPQQLSYEVVAEYPHDSEAFTQGLVIHEGKLFESTGLRGQSTLREVDLDSGQVLRQVRLPDRFFGEGLTVMDNRLIQLTWQAGVGIVYDLETFQVVQRFDYSGEGWGLTHDGSHLIMSDGSSSLRFLDLETFEVVRTLQVSMDGKPLRDLNELEFVEGSIVANVLFSDRIVWINPSGGNVTRFLDLFDLMPRRPVDQQAVLNGVALDPATGDLLVTGKLWPKLFRLKVTAPGS